MPGALAKAAALFGLETSLLGGEVEPGSRSGLTLGGQSLSDASLGCPVREFFSSLTSLFVVGCLPFAVTAPPFSTRTTLRTTPLPTTADELSYCTGLVRWDDRAMKSTHCQRTTQGILVNAQDSATLYAAPHSCSLMQY